VRAAILRGHRIGARRTGIARARSSVVRRDPASATPFLLIRLAESSDRAAGLPSHGQKQWLEIGMLLMRESKRLRLDEPTEGIQPSIIRDIERAILVVERYYDFAKSLAVPYLVMERGELIARGRGADMYRDGVRAMLAV
jgi:urea transport system ATP-binding protein